MRYLEIGAERIHQDAGVSAQADRAALDRRTVVLRFAQRVVDVELEALAPAFA